VHQVGFSLHDYIEMHGQQNIKSIDSVYIRLYSVCIVHYLAAVGLYLQVLCTYVLQKLRQD